MVLGTEYFFEFSLYELIIPKDSHVEVRNSAVNIGLRKKTKGMWPRLLKQKTVKVFTDAFTDAIRQNLFVLLQWGPKVFGHLEFSP